MKKRFFTHGILWLIHYHNRIKLYRNDEAFRECRRLCRFMTGKGPTDVSTTANQKLIEACHEEIRRQCPQLATYPLPTTLGKEATQRWLRDIKRHIGDRFDITPLPPELVQKIIIENP